MKGQLDLTELVGVEHINGSMPAGESENEQARQAFYQQFCLNDVSKPGPQEIETYQKGGCHE